MNKIISIRYSPTPISSYNLTPAYECPLEALNIFFTLRPKHLAIITDIIESRNIKTVIDIGCGSGFHAHQLFKHTRDMGLNGVNIYAVDSNNKDHFSPETKLPFVNDLDATTFKNLGPSTLLISIWPFASYTVSDASKYADCCAANLTQNGSGKVEPLINEGVTAEGLPYSFQAHWLNRVIENNPNTSMIHFGKSDNLTVGTIAIFSGYITKSFDIPNSTSYLLDYRNQCGDKKRKGDSPRY
jgi:hypothetical protein